MQVYFDNAASTMVSTSVAAVAIKTMIDDYANPSAKHIKGLQAERYLKEASVQIAKTLKVSEKEIIYTSGGTESNNLALIGAAEARKRYGKHIISTSIEHPAVYEVLAYLESIGYEYSILSVDERGHISLEELKSLLREDTILVSVMYVNNEIGAVQDISSIAELVHNYNKEIYFHTDAIQAYGKLRIHPKKEGIDLLSVSGHKLHAPKGIGFLYIDERVNIKPIVFGGGQQRGLRSGTLNIPGIAAMGEAAREAYDNFDEKIRYLYDLKDFIINELESLEDVQLNSYRGELSVAHVISVSVKGIRSEVLLHALEDKGIYVASGSACSSNHPGISGTLKGIGLHKDYLDSTIRISLSAANTKEEAVYFIDCLKELLPVLRRYR